MKKKCFKIYSTILFFMFHYYYFLKPCVLRSAYGLSKRSSVTDCTFNVCVQYVSNQPACHVKNSNYITNNNNFFIFIRIVVWLIKTAVLSFTQFRWNCAIFVRNVFKTQRKWRENITRFVRVIIIFRGKLHDDMRLLRIF